MAKNKVVSKTRRANGEGSIFQRKDGRWVGNITIGYDDKGQQKRRLFMAIVNLKWQRNCLN